MSARQIQEKIKRCGHTVGGIGIVDVGVLIVGGVCLGTVAAVGRLDAIAHTYRQEPKPCVPETVLFE